MQKNIEKCPHCKQRVKGARWESLNSGLVRLLILMIEAVKRKRENKVHYLNDLRLGYVATANFQKLRFHGLIAHYDRENLKSGLWLITVRGGQFLRGEIRVPKQVMVFDNEVIEHSLETVHIKDLKRLPTEFQSEYAYEYFMQVQRPEVASKLF